MEPHILDRYGSEIRTALLIRFTEERLLRLFAEGKLFGTVHTCIGQEFVGVSVSRNLVDGDTVFSNHRGHGHFISYCGNVPGLIGEIMGKSTGVCAGRGGSQHTQEAGFFSNGIQGGITPVATGLAMAHSLKEKNNVSVVYVGDGTLGQGALYESMNFASIWNLPVLFVCENNLYAQSTSQKQTLSGDICARAAAFGIDTAHSDTWEWQTLLEQMESSIARIRETGRPMFHRVDTYRLMAHSKGDDNRPDEEVAPYRERDPLNSMLKELAGDERWKALVEEVSAEVERAVEQADAAPFDEVEQPARWSATATHGWEPLSFEREKVVQSVRKGLEAGLRDDERVVVIGEDIESPYGGAFKATMGLSHDFPGRVRNTPISELALVGIGNGLALGGMLPVVEIMFGDFLALAMDQWLNHAAKFQYMFNDKVRMPVVIRTPMGGKRGYASTHSQSIEKHFLGLPGTQVLCLHHRYPAEQLYKDLFATIDRPSLVIENKILYGKFASSDAPAGYRVLKQKGEAFPTVRIKPDAPADVTIVAMGGMSLDAEQALLELFEEMEIVVDLFLPTRMYPFDVDVLHESISQTRKLVVAEEGQGFVSLSSEILAQVAERYPELGVVCRRVAAAPNPIPAARPLEEQCLPQASDIIRLTMEAVGELVH